jgi:hypothetical protein
MPYGRFSCKVRVFNAFCSAARAQSLITGSKSSKNKGKAKYQQYLKMAARGDSGSIHLLILGQTNAVKHILKPKTYNYEKDNPYCSARFLQCS